MMDDTDHVCERDFEVNFSFIEDISDGLYTCACCSQRMKTICLLHEHLLKQFSVGSYLYDHCTKTAYPKLPLVTAGTQTDAKDWQDNGLQQRMCDTPSNEIGLDDSGLHEFDRTSTQSKSIGTASLSRKRKHKTVEDDLKKVVEVIKKKSRRNEIATNIEKIGGEIISSGETSLAVNAEREQSRLDVDQSTHNDKYDESTDDNLDIEVNGKVEFLPDKTSQLTRKTNKKSGRNVKRKGSGESKKIENRQKKSSLKVRKIKIKKFRSNQQTSEQEMTEENRPDFQIDQEIPEQLRNGRKKETKVVYNCEHCDIRFYSEKSLNAHLQSVHKCIYPYSCKQCNKKPFKTKEEYNEHKEMHPKQTYNCELCGKELKSKEGLRLHEFTHSGEKPFSCTECDYRGRTSAQLRQHMYNHKDNKTEQCELCGKAFYTKGKLKEHLRYCRKEFNHHCPHCQKGFPTASGLRKHVLMHTGERQFVCDVCGFATYRSTLLKSHMRTHTGEKPYKCKECGAQLATRGTLLLHLRTHTHEKPFVCSFCTKAFTSKWNLKTHLRQHTGEKPYMCDICGQGFKQNVLRKSHMRTHLESTSVEPEDHLNIPAAKGLQVTSQSDIPEYVVQTDTGIAENIDTSHLMRDKMDSNRPNIGVFEYDRPGTDILQQALQSENIHPLDLKLHFSTADDLKNPYTSVMNSQQTPPNSFEMVHYQNLKHI